MVLLVTRGRLLSCGKKRAVEVTRWAKKQSSGPKKKNQMPRKRLSKLSIQSEGRRGPTWPRPQNSKLSFVVRRLARMSLFSETSEEVVLQGCKRPQVGGD